MVIGPYTKGENSDEHLESRHGTCRSDTADLVRAAELSFLSGSARLR